MTPGREHYELEWLTPLYLGDPPFHHVQRILRDARRAVGRNPGTPGSATRHSYDRRVHKELSRRLYILGIFVEGETDVAS